MKASVILSHPYPKSFNHAIYNTVITTLRECGIPAFCHDLYKEDFNPVLTAAELGSDTSDDPLVNRYAAELVESGLLFFIHPNWWGQPPAMLKGYIDRVVRPPHAYDFPPGNSGGGLPLQKLRGKCGVIFNTSNTPAEREVHYFGDPLEKIWKQCVFGFLGIEKFHRRMFGPIADSSAEDRNAWLETVADDVRKIAAGTIPV